MSCGHPFVLFCTNTKNGTAGKQESSTALVADTSTSTESEVGQFQQILGKELDLIHEVHEQCYKSNFSAYRRRLFQICSFSEHILSN